MTKILTEYDEFTPDIYVPEGSDSRDHAAEDVELIAQRLVNRTKNLLTHGVKRDAPNTFTADQTIAGKLTTQTLDVSGAAKLPTITGPTSISGNVGVSGNITAATIDSNGDLFAADDVIATDSFQYAVARAVTKKIDPLAFVCLQAGSSGSAWYGEGQYVEMAPGGNVIHVIRAPDGATLGLCKIKVQAVVGAATVIVKLKRRYNISMGNALLPTYGDVKVNSGIAVALDSVVVIATADGALVDLTFGNMAVVKDEGYLIYVQNKSDSVGNVRLYAGEVQYTDPGPRNY